MRATLLLCVIAALAQPLFAQTSQPAEGVALTVYNGGYGVVRESSNLDIGPDGLARFADVAKLIDPTTVHFESLTDPSAKLLEQNYQYDLVSADKLLEKYIDQPIIVGAQGSHPYSGKLLSFDAGQLVIQTDTGIVMVQRPQNVQDIQFGKLPEGLLTQPTLLWKVATEKPGKQLALVTYQTSGLTWHAEYVLVVNPTDTSADLSGWVSVQNNSGKTYRDARLKFIAGEVRRIQPMPAQLMMRRGAMAAKADESAGMEEKPFFEYHMYTLPRPSTVSDNEVKQLEMFTPVRDLKIDKRYLYSPMGSWRMYGEGRFIEPTYGVRSDKKVAIFIEFRNDEKNHLGIPLPAGKVRVFKQDPQDKALEFIGEEQIDHTPKDEDLSLQIGNAFDVVGERKQTAFQVDNGRRWMTETIEVRIRNHKAQDVTVRVKEPMYRWTAWKITEESAKHLDLDARTLAWDLPVKADGETVLTYTVEYTW